MDRAIWGYVDKKSWTDDSVDVTITQGGVLFEVTQEKAVDSYNEEFTCQCLVPFAAVPELCRLLESALRDSDTHR